MWAVVPVKELEGAKQYRELIAYAESVKDYVTRDLAREILADEEGHIDFLESQLQLLNTTRKENELYFGRAYGFQVLGLQGISTATEAMTMAALDILKKG